MKGGPRRRSRGPVPQQWVPTGYSRPTSTDESPASAVGEAAVAADGGGAADAVNVQRVPGEVEESPCPCPLSGSEEENEDKKSIAVTVSEFQAGDSVYEEGDLDDVKSEGEVAVATEKEEKRSKRQPRDITPIEQRLKSKWATRNDAEHVGNIGWLFGNWGKRPKDEKRRNHLDKVLKKQPAMVIGLAECQEESELVLAREPAAVAVAAKPGAKGKFKYRPEFKYLTLRGR